MVEKNGIVENESITNMEEKIASDSFEVSKNEDSGEITVESSIADKLASLYNLQQICSQIDKIKIIRGELPDEIRDLEDTTEGLKTRLEKYNEETEQLRDKIKGQEVKAAESKTLIERYQEQQNNVRNNREYDSLSKEIEFQTLEIQVAEKYQNKFAGEIEVKQEEIASCQSRLDEIVDILEQKKAELSDIIAETEKEEIALLERAEELKKKVDQRLLTAFERIRNNARNGLAVVLIEREACGGCFSKIPPQHQLDIRLHKKIIVCEACGRIFVDKDLAEQQAAQ